MGEVDIQAVLPNRVSAFLSGNGPVTSNWPRKHCALISFYRYAIAHGHVEYRKRHPEGVAMHAGATVNRYLALLSKI